MNRSENNIFKILLFLLLTLVNRCRGNEQCSQVLSDYFQSSGTRAAIQMTTIYPNGKILYSRGNSLFERGFSNDLSNVDSYYGISSTETACFQSKEQPFSVKKSFVNFFDSRSFSISRDGFVSIYSVSQGSVSFNLTSCRGQILYGVVNDVLYTFHLVKDQKYQMIGRECGTEPVYDDRVQFVTKILGSWVDNGDTYSTFETEIQNVGNLEINALVFNQEGMELKHPSNIWGVSVISKYQFSLANYIHSIAPSQYVKFSYIARGMVPPKFTVSYISPK
ncbi:hypothetical protein DLAC_06942 [Tieghemostelium lacteum]|uniref:Carbohydrate binding domain-containing protein n=1 Tax=Tieghemostelium lacteum TaxID=361077 RepID=A0A151ZDS1_TIELA|nr:hypothetical protein DLAC_06942 [Tieghemostelium lacteum]|eukprot:KYQ92103.1 hypothetical protein DLAC_06942 [Tieghemostelium lacteum]